MERFNKIIFFSSFTCFCICLKKNIQLLVLGGIILGISPTIHAAGPVKALSNKALKKIEEKYDRDMRNLFSGKDSDKNVLALKRLMEEGVDPDLAVIAIKKYNEAKKYRSGSVQKRKALGEIEALFSSSELSWKKGRDIIMGSRGAVVARKTKTTQKTYTANNKPSCRSKRTVRKRAPKIKYQDADRLAENRLLEELQGEDKHGLVAMK